MPGAELITSATSTIILGASSQVGYFLLPALLDSGLPVIAVSRHPVPAWFEAYKNHPQLRWCQFDEVYKLPQTLPLKLVSAAPLSLLEPLLEHLNLIRVIALSSASVLFKQHSEDEHERKLMATILKAEYELENWAKPAQKSLCILRPTLIYGCGLDKNLSRVAALIKRWHFLPLAAAAKGLRQPLHAADLAALISRLLATESIPKNSLAADINTNYLWSLAGGSTVTYREMMQAVFDALEIKTRLLNLPPQLLSTLSPFINGLNRQMIQRQNQDLCIDDSPARQLLNWSPRRFSLQQSELST